MMDVRKMERIISRILTERYGAEVKIDIKEKQDERVPKEKN